MTEVYAPHFVANERVEIHWPDGVVDRGTILERGAKFWCEEHNHSLIPVRIDSRRIAPYQCTGKSDRYLCPSILKKPNA